VSQFVFSFSTFLAIGLEAEEDSQVAGEFMWPGWKFPLPSRRIVCVRTGNRDGRFLGTLLCRGGLSISCGFQTKPASCSVAHHNFHPTFSPSGIWGSCKIKKIERRVEMSPHPADPGSSSCQPVVNCNAAHLHFQYG